MKGWVKLFRDLLDWEWYQDINASRLLVHLLLTVNYQEKKWKGIIVKPGSIILSWETLSNSVGLSIQQCRTAMDKLIDSKEVTKKSTNKYQVITLVKWEEFQLSEVEDNKENNRQLTGHQHSNNIQITTTKESKEDLKNSNKERKKFRPPSENEVIKFFNENGLDLNAAEKKGRKFWLHFNSIKWKTGNNRIKDWKPKALIWIEEDKDSKNQLNKFQNNKTDGNSNSKNGRIPNDDEIRKQADSSEYLS